MRLRYLFVYVLSLFLFGVTISVRVSALDEALKGSPAVESVREIDRSIVFESDNKDSGFEANDESVLEVAAEVVDREVEGGGGYDIKRGDSLWDISAVYYKSPWRWREIWEANVYIKNPNLIYPHDKLVIPGVTSRGFEAVEVPLFEEQDETGAVEEEEYEEAWYEEEEHGEIELSPSLSGTVDYEMEGKYMREGFVVPLDWEYDGYVVGSAERKVMLSAGDLVFLDIGKEDGLESQVRCGIYRLGKKVRAQESRKVIGRVVKKIAVVETTSDVESNVSTARVISSSDYIKKGDYVRILSVK